MKPGSTGDKHDPGKQERGKKIRAALLGAEGLGDCLRLLCRVAQEADSKKSLSWVCRRAGIRSPGSLSDVMTGRRKLNLKYVDPLAEALGLATLEQTYLQVLAKRQYATRDRRAELDKQLATLRAALSFQLSGDGASALPLVAYEVFAAFGLVAGGVGSLGDFVRLFPQYDEPLLQQSLVALERQGLIRKATVAPSAAERRKGTVRYEITERNVLFSSDGSDFKQFVVQGVETARRDIDQWYNDSAMSFFQSTLISVTQKRYQELLARMRETLIAWQMEAESDPADLVIILNVQAFPSALGPAVANTKVTKKTDEA